MRRPPHGGTTRPGPARPGNGYGRPVRGWPREVVRLEEPEWLDPAWWLAATSAGRPSSRRAEHA